MKKTFRVLCTSMVCVFVFLTAVGAASVYEGSTKSGTHTYSLVSQYYISRGDITDFGSDRTLTGVNHTWYSSGSGSYTVSHSAVRQYATGNYVKKYVGESKIGSSTMDLYSTFNY